MSMYLSALGLNCALGHDKASVARGLFAGDCSGMQRQSGWVPERSVTVGAVKGELATIAPELTQQSSRNNQLLLEAALQVRNEIDQAIKTFGPERIAIVLGTSTSGIDEASRGIAHYLHKQQFPSEYDY